MLTSALSFQTPTSGGHVDDDGALASALEPPAAQAGGNMHHPGHAVGASLEARIAGHLPTLSPKLQEVAEYCLQHARHLHLCRIRDIAEHCNTQPVSVVRLAKRYGFRGFLDFKMAFLVDADGAAPRVPEHSPWTKDTPELHAMAGKSAVVQQHANAAMEQCRRDMLQLEADWSEHAFCRAVDLLKQARTVWMHSTKEAAQVANCYANMLRVAGLTVQWIRLPDDSTPNPWEPSARDVLLSLSLTPDGEGDFDAARMVQRIGVPVIAVTDGLDGFLSSSADAHLCVAHLGDGIHGISAGIVLAHAVHDALSADPSQPSPNP